LDTLIIPDKAQNRAKDTEIEKAEPVHQGVAEQVCDHTFGQSSRKQKDGACDRGIGHCFKVGDVLHDTFADQRITDPAQDGQKYEQIPLPKTFCQHTLEITPGYGNHGTGNGYQYADNFNGIQFLFKQECWGHGDKNGIIGNNERRPTRMDKPQSLEEKHVIGKYSAKTQQQ